jgi:hypothetical protein
MASSSGVGSEVSASCWERFFFERDMEDLLNYTLVIQKHLDVMHGTAHEQGPPSAFRPEAHPHRVRDVRNDLSPLDHNPGKGTHEGAIL